MSTLAKLRNVSPVQFIDSLRRLVNHTDKYTKKLPKSDTLIWRIPLHNQSLETLQSAIRGNAIRIKTKDDFLRRREHFLNALGWLDVFEEGLATLLYDEHNFATITEGKDSPIITWAELIDKSRRLLEAVVKSDETKFHDFMETR